MRETRGTKHRWRKCYIPAGSLFDRQFLARTRGTDTASTAYTRSCQRSRSSESRKKFARRRRESVCLDSLTKLAFSRPRPERGIIPDRKGRLLRGRSEAHRLRGTVLGRVRSWGIVMATYAAYRHVELDNVGYGKKR